MIFYNVETPFLLETSITFSKEISERMISTILSQRDTANYHNGYTFHITDLHGDFKELYRQFFNIATTVFGPLSLSPRHKQWCWANVYNKDSFRTNMHHHTNTSSINAVYYLKIPNNIPTTEGGLSIISNNSNLVLFLPEEGDLIIMPADTLHEPQYHSSLDFRIAINMEITTTNHVSSYYTLPRIYKNAIPKL